MEALIKHFTSKGEVGSGGGGGGLAHSMEAQFRVNTVILESYYVVNLILGFIFFILHCICFFVLFFLSKNE